MSAGFVPINQGKNQPDLALCCGPVSQRGGNIKKKSTGKKIPYNWILQHPQVVQSPIANYCLKLSIDDQVEPNLFPKLLLQVSVRELHNSMVIPPKEGGIKEARNTDNNIIISDSTWHKIVPPQLKKMTSRYKVMCGCECCISSKSIHSPMLTWRYFCLKHHKDRSENAQNRRSGKISSRIFETYKNTVRPYGCYI